VEIANVAMVIPLWSIPQLVLMDELLSKADPNPQGCDPDRV
jgi:hypothetical protein